MRKTDPEIRSVVVIVKMAYHKKDQVPGLPEDALIPKAPVVTTSFELSPRLTRVPARPFVDFPLRPDFFRWRERKIMASWKIPRGQSTAQ